MSNTMKSYKLVYYPINFVYTYLGKNTTLKIKTKER